MMTEAKDRWQGPGEDLPLSPDQASETALALARVWSRLSTPVTVPLKRLGDLQVQPDEIALIDDWAHVQTEGMAWFKLVRAMERAWLGVSLEICHGLIRAVLGGEPPLLIRPLGSAERGLMAAFVSSALSTLGLARCVAVVPDEGRPGSLEHPVVLTGTIRGLAGIHGRALFVGPLSWLTKDGVHDSLTTRVQDTPVQGVLELGRTMVSKAELCAATPGDAIVFDGTPNLPPGSTWPVSLLVGKSHASARLGVDCSLSLDGAWETRDAGWADPLDAGVRWRSSAPTSSEPTGSAGASVDVAAELGRIDLLWSELVGLCKGESLALGPRPSDHILLRVHGQPWATGLLVALGGQLGVRIVRLRG